MPAKLVFNGIYGDTGGYALPPMSSSEITAIARASLKTGELANPDIQDSLQERRYLDGQKGHLGPKEGVEPKDLAQAGWGVIFARDADPALIEALRPLLNLRKSQASKIKEKRYRELKGNEGYTPGTTKAAFLDNRGAGGGGSADPDRLPYYLLIVGSPDVIPWSFQYQLDVQYAVGRLWFDSPTYEPYANYARSVVEAEKGGVALARRATFFGPSCGDDLATQLSSGDLIAPLGQLMQDEQPNWTVERLSPADSTKVRLTSLLGGADTPAVLFTATHGMLYHPGDDCQLAKMGAFLCAEWPGPSFSGLVPESFYFAGDDVASDAKLAGLISFHFACFGAGVPLTDDYTPLGQGEPPALANRPFVAQLPQRLLGHPKGGALAMVGHVDRAWGYSFKSENGDTQIGTFRDALTRLMDGHPIGSALEPFNRRYAELSTDLLLADGKNRDEDEWAFLWTCNNDARNYVVMGDPAVRLQLASDPSKVRRETLMPIEVHTVPPQGAVNFGIFADAKEPLQDVSRKIVAKLVEAVDAMTTVEVSTYTSADMEAAKAGQLKGATLRAYSRVRLDGNAEVCVPEDSGKVDEALWKIHSDMVQKALDNRTAMLKAIAEAVASLKML